MATLTVTNAAIDAVRDLLNGVVGAAPLGITWFAIGTGTQGTPATATQLAAEVFRMPITSFGNGAAHGESITNALLAPTVAAGAIIAEIGFFGGFASSAANSGTLIFYGLYSHTHTAGESIQFTADSTV
jgi:hypothetical protein